MRGLRGWVCIVGAALAAAGGASPATAQAACALQHAAASDTQRWPAPLSRVVAIDSGVMSLRTALERLAAAAKVHFTYSPELLPLGRAVCVEPGSRPAGDVLAAVLRGTGIKPIVAGSDQVVLAPGQSAAVASATPRMARSTGHLERVVVTGTVTGGRERASPHALAVLEVPRDAAAGSLTLAETFNGVLPGVWMWPQVPSSPSARYGSVRGASSFGVTAPKVYVDGIEAANPLMVTHLDPSRVERVELIRGPQGSALYGADAISGVVNIITRHDNTATGAPLAELRASAGAAASAYATRGILAQEHGLTVRGGSAARSGAAGLTASTLGAYIPGATARHVDAHASIRQIGSRTIVNGVARLHAANDDAAISPLLSDAAASFFADSATPQRTRQYTIGGSVTLQASDRWSHTATVGLDGYRLAGIAAETLPIPSPSDSALRAARGGADRGSLRLHSALAVGADSLVGATITFGAEQSSAREELFWRGEGTPGQGNVHAPAEDQVTTAYHNTGVLAQARIVTQNMVFITLGARVERMSSSRAEARTSLLPMTGIAVARDLGAWTLKARTAYGRGIRPARTVARGASLIAGRNYAAQPLALDPEEQSGLEWGIDVYWGSRAALQLTRFTQLVSGLVQPVAVGVMRPDSSHSASPPAHARGDGRVVYQLQNVGAIDNTGWEAQGSSTLGAVTLTGSVAHVDSRVVQLAPGYRGDLRKGDQMLEVPRRTAGASATWRASRWSSTVSVARAMDWVNYDKLALADRVATDGATLPLGEELRRYWRRYGGVTRVNARVAFTPTRRASLTIAGENLLNQQRDEPDNLTVVPGRTIIFGVRTTF